MSQFLYSIIWQTASHTITNMLLYSTSTNAIIRHRNKYD